MIFNRVTENRKIYTLLYEMTLRDIRLRYKHAIFGILWIIFTPLVQMLIIASIFGYFIKTPVEGYHLFLFTGLIYWNFFSLSLTKSATSILDQRSLIQKAVFPRVVIPLSVVLSNFFHFLVSLVLLAVWSLLTGNLDAPVLILLPLSLILILVLTAGFSLLISGLNVKYRDITYFLSIFLQVLFYATPVLYPLSLIPEDLRSWFVINPLTGVLQISQLVFSNVNEVNPVFVSAAAVSSLILFITGWKVFNKLSSNFDDWV